MSENTSQSGPYPDVEASPSFPKIEEEILAAWDKDKTFERSVTQRSTDNEFVFYDGPPFANGLPHYGHLITSFVKDAIPRYQTMRGKRVERRFGWDCHGLPAEMLVEKELGVSGHVQIEQYGIDKFNAYCQSSVQRFTQEWQDYIRRMARWVSFENDYKTMDMPYMESVMWAFKTLHEKGLIYEGQRVLPFCWECETPLSNFETRLDDAYRERQDPALTVTFQLLENLDGKPTFLLAWTTTPWTLPSNLALAVGPDIQYALLEEDGKHFVLAEAARERYEKELSKANFVRSVSAQELIGQAYEPMFPFFVGHQHAFQIFGADFVNTEDGAGIVHIAPYGEDDFDLLTANSIELVTPVDQSGKFDSTVPAYEGMQVFDANKQISSDLKAVGKIVRHETYVHNYPHCWRTDTPLIYRPVSSWFVEVVKVKKRALELNEEINWYPEHVKHGAFGKWLANAHDWSISRNRFWGSPIPVWKSDDPRYPRVDVYGSLDDLERDFGVRPKDLHRPYIDELTRPNPDDPTGQSTMRRVEEVLDCWFESGSMPYAQVHYPFENKEWFESHFPADFIVEYVGQARAWFYNLHVLGTALFDKHPFNTCLAHGVLLGNDGRKLSKRLKNYPDPIEAFNKYGADAMRWSLISSGGLRGLDLIVDEKLMADSLRRIVIPIWNAYYFFTLYANADGIKAEQRTDSQGVLDRYIMAKTNNLIETVTDCMDNYDISGACDAIESYIDALNNWYIRRSRDRFWKAEHDQDKRDAYDTLFTALTMLTQVIAPLLPLISDAIYTGLTGNDSVHLSDWPDVKKLPADNALVNAMDEVREVCSAALSVRKAERLRVRLPLAKLTVAAEDAEQIRPFIELVADEVNVKEVELSADVHKFGDRVLQLNLAVLAPRMGSETQDIIKKVKKGDWTLNPNGAVDVDGYLLPPDDFNLKLEPKNSNTSRALPGRNGIVVLDTNLTAELEIEGYARDIVRAIQNARRNADLKITDHIEASVTTSSVELTKAIETHREYISSETLAEVLQEQELPDVQHGEDVDIEGFPTHIALKLAK